MFLSKFFAKARPEKRLPNLVCVGVEKCGTTFLNAAFAPCGNVLTPRKKELFFFNQHFDEGTQWYRSWYDFDSKPGARYIADITPSYFRSPRNLERIRSLLPDAKIVMVLRHPVYRSFSHYVHRIRHVAPDLQAYGHSYADILAGKDAYNLLCPQYGKHLQWLLDYFDPGNILVLTYETDILNPLNAQAKLSEFLQLDDLDFSPMVGRRVNEGKMPRFYYGGAAGSGAAGSGAAAGGEYPHPKPGTLLLAHAKGTQVWHDVEPAVAHANLAAAQHWTHALSSEEVQTIYHEHFATDMEIVHRQFGIDVDQWRSMTNPVHYADAQPDPDLLVAGGPPA